MDEKFEKNFKSIPAPVRWGAGIVLLLAVITAAGIAWDWAVPILRQAFTDISPLW